MVFGNILVYISLILAILGIVLTILKLWTEDERLGLYARLITLLLFLTTTAALLYLYILFITSDVSVLYVWTYTDASYSLTYKISGVLAGMDGSLLFWIWLVILPWFWEEVRAVKKPRDEKLMDWTRIFLFLVMALLLLVLSIHKIFDPTPSDYLSYRPDGNGLNPILQTFLMAIHPPIIFVAYGFLALPFAAGLAYLVTGNEKWTDICLNWSRIGWFFLTVGIGIGALWAYVVLGWGGYWGWDPVETSSLLPWILLTGFLHVQLMYRRKKDYKILAPVLGAFTFILVMFATFATRAGGLWVSVHTFGEANVDIAPWDRFMDIMTTSDTVPYYFIMMIAFSILTIILMAYRQRKMGSRGEERSYTLSELINDDMLMLATTFLLVLTTVVTLLILVRGVEGQLVAENFNGPVGVLVLLLILAMVFCISWRILGRKVVSMVALGTVAASLVAMMLFPDNIIAAGAIPILAVSLTLVSYSIIKRFNRQRPWQSLKVISAHLIHLAVILMVIGYVGSSFLASEQSINLEVGGDSQTIFGYTFEAVDITESSDMIYAEMHVHKGSDLVGVANPGISVIDGQMRSEIKVVDTLVEDIYLIYNFDQMSYSHNTVDIEVKILPMMKFLWGGMWLMGIGIVLRLILEFYPKKGKGSKILADEDAGSGEAEASESKEAGTSEPVEKDDDYYESMLEAELEKAEAPEQVDIVEDKRDDTIEDGPDEYNKEEK
ncbi:MAG: cytochrome c biogenesis protein CcsA [Thermoplasmata archaeon]|nr:cytochrome c biogenesis protein CcsA [Thermoplasmata archaeon]